MLITKKRIRSIDNNIRGINRGETVVVALRDINRLTDHLRRAGYSKELAVGETILPSAIGAVSRFNARGKYHIHKDQAKETYYTTRYWTRNEFRGRNTSEEVTGIIEIPGKRYPRTLILPPSIELTITEDKAGTKILRAPELNFIEENDPDLIHVINLFLEHFGECEILSKDLSTASPAKLIRLNWDVLPQGKMPWAQLNSRLTPIINRQPKGNRSIINKRHETIHAHGPDFVAVGNGGFDGYIVFGFPDKNIYILESTEVNNATYVLEWEWEELSQLSKAELLNNRLHKERLIHRTTWFSEINRILK